MRGMPGAYYIWPAAVVWPCHSPRFLYCSRLRTHFLTESTYVTGLSVLIRADGDSEQLKFLWAWSLVLEVYSAIQTSRVSK